jgi:hypothetical protein
MMPIPMILLKSNIQYFEKITDGKYEGGFKDPITINKVLIQYSTTVKRSDPGNQEIQTAGKLFIDCVNSSPVIDMKFGSKIICIEDNKEFFIGKVEPVKAFVLHHYEVELL